MFGSCVAGFNRYTSFLSFQVAEDRDSGGEQFGALQHLSLKIIKGLNCKYEYIFCFYKKMLHFFALAV